MSAPLTRRLAEGEERWKPHRVIEVESRNNHQGSTTEPSDTGDERRAARTASRGAIVFIVVLELIVAFLVHDSWIHRHEHSLPSNFQSRIHLCVLAWIVETAAHWFMWGSHPGYGRVGAAAASFFRSPSLQAHEIEKAVIAPSNDKERNASDEGSSSAAVFHPETGERWCVMCHNWSPLRSKHCWKCGRCVLRFDHHCFWLGTCVGQDNHRRFIFTLAIMTWGLCHGIDAVLACIVFDLELHRTYDIVVRVLLPIALVIVGTGLFFMVVGLLLFHLHLVFVGQTTWENFLPDRISYLKSLGRKEPFPFDYGWRKNTRDFCCGTMPRRWTLGHRHREVEGGLH